MLDRGSHISSRDLKGSRYLGGVRLYCARLRNVNQKILLKSYKNDQPLVIQSCNERNFISCLS